ncbi:MAG: winged helix-turn-helix transcriptional regulator [Holophagaceae bacterium]|nr:winged helix-turn-helix transcriptional regulator [Holophagaceae bacterium]
MENQKTEWKRQWRDDFLKGLCGLANAQGGTLEIGRDSKGAVVGLDNPKELLEELPNIVRHALGIVPSVELLDEAGKQYIAVSVEASSTPISFRGRHYLRSGSTTQELGGSELDNFILRRVGKTWDGIVIPKLKATDLDTSAFRKFRERALASERLQKADLEMSDGELLDSLSLTENGELTRAAVMLFHHNPEKYVFGAFVKVGYFENGADLIYQDEFHGSLITMADQIVDTIYRKYYKGIISYEGLQRIEDFPVPRPALREAILNAIVHRDYTTGIPIQIKVFPDSTILWNDGRLPENWTVADLLSKHRSRPYNPKIANAFYRAGYIETWGRGIERITAVCKHAGKSKPLFEASPSEVKVSFFYDARIGENIVDGIVENDVSIVEKVGAGSVKSSVKTTQEAILKIMRRTPTISAKAIATEIGIAPRNVQAHIRELKKSGSVERIGPAKGGHWEVKGQREET